VKHHCSAQVPKRQWNAGASSAQVSLSFSGRRVAWGTILKLHRLEKAPQPPVCFATTLATTFGRFGPSRNRLNTGDSFKSKTGVDTRDIPTLTNPSPPTHQLGFQSLRHISRDTRKHAVTKVLPGATWVVIGASLAYGLFQELQSAVAGKTIALVNPCSEPLNEPRDSSYLFRSASSA